LVKASGLQVLLPPCLHSLYVEGRHLKVMYFIVVISDCVEFELRGTIASGHQTSPLPTKSISSSSSGVKRSLETTVDECTDEGVALDASSRDSLHGFQAMDLTGYPLTITQFSSGQYGQVNNIAMRLALPEGTSRFVRTYTRIIKESIWNLFGPFP